MATLGATLSSVNLPLTATTISVTPSTTISIDITTGSYAKWTAGENETVNLTGTQFANQRLTIIILSDASIRTITFGTGFKPSATLVTVASKTYVLEFVSDGTTFDEASRSAALT